MEDGSGLANMIPALQSSRITYSPEVVCLLYNGKQDTIFEGQTFLVKEMPSFRHLSATEITNIINYVNHRFLPDFREKSIKSVEEELTGCKN
jgi:hypothetical protein